MLHYGCQGTKLTINILLLVKCQIYFHQSNFFLSWVAKEMLLDVIGYWQLMGELKNSLYYEDGDAESPRENPEED